MEDISLKGLVRELRRRRTFRAPGLYFVGAGPVMQVPDVVLTACDGAYQDAPV